MAQGRVMVNFIFGTYDGLFVESDQPTQLPSQEDFFDFRRNEGKLIPVSESPSLVIRYFDEGGASGGHFFVGVVFKALDNFKRPGFIACGCHAAETTPKTVWFADALKSAVRNMGKIKPSSDGCAKRLSLPKAGGRIDFSDLLNISDFRPSAGYKLDWREPQNAQKIAEYVNELYETFPSFELFFDPEFGDSIENFDSFWGEQCRLLKIAEREREELKVQKAHEEKRRAAQERLNQQKLKNHDDGEDYYLTEIKIVLVVIAVLLAMGLVAFTTYYFGFADNTPISKPVPQSLPAVETKIGQSTSSPEPSPDPGPQNNSASTPVKDKQPNIEKGCSKEDLLVNENVHFGVLMQPKTILSSSETCLTLSEATVDFLKDLEPELEYRVFSNSIVQLEELQEVETLLLKSEQKVSILMSFQHFLNLNIGATPQPNFGFYISEYRESNITTEDENILISCSKEVIKNIEDNGFPAEGFSFAYYVTDPSESPYMSLLKNIANVYFEDLKRGVRKIANEQGDGYSSANTTLQSLETAGVNRFDLTSITESQRRNVCVLTADNNDQDDLETITHDEPFVRANVLGEKLLTFTDYLECRGIPSHAIVTNYLGDGYLGTFTDKTLTKEEESTDIHIRFQSKNQQDNLIYPEFWIEETPQFHMLGNFKGGANPSSNILYNDFCNISP